MIIQGNYKMKFLKIGKAALELDKSENGKGTTTTSPFTNYPMLYPPLDQANPLLNSFRLQVLYHLFLDFYLYYS